MKQELFPQDIIVEYGLKDKVDNDVYIFCEMKHGMYRQPHDGILAQELVTERLFKAG